MTSRTVNTGVAHLQEQSGWKLNENMRTGACELILIFTDDSHTYIEVTVRAMVYYENQ